MPVLKIDGKEIEVAPGTTILQALDRLGIEIPRYCYHPGLSIAGNCRICMVEVTGLPTTVIACNTVCADKMEVWTDSPKARETRRGILEFLLVNHPLDCPVCDQSGECGLQDYYMKFGQYDSRLNDNKVRKRKAVPVGPHVMLDQERCILCSRCVRFTDEIAKSHELGIFGRGDHACVDILPGGELTNPYSGCVVDVCPVGALTDRDFRFKCRVWYLEKTDSICTGCARGCSIQVHANTHRPQHGGGDRIMRLKPRFNPHVNRWWMCDEGRYGWKPVDAEDRLRTPVVRGTPASWSDALGKTVTLLRDTLSKHGADAVAVLLSPQMSNEELWRARKVFGEVLGIRHIGFQVPPASPGFEDEILVRADKNPNTRGAEALGVEAGMKSEGIRKALAEGKLRALYVVDHDLPALPKLDALVYQGTNANGVSAKAGVLLPSAAWAEREGTFTNCDGRVQRFRRAFEPIEEARPGLDILAGLAEAAGEPVAPARAEDVFEEIAASVADFRGMTYPALDPHGLPLASSRKTMEPPARPTATAPWGPA